MSETNSITQQFMTKAANIGILEPVDLIFHLPTKYSDFRTPQKSFRTCIDLPDSYFFKVKILTKPSVSVERGRPSRTSILVTDGFETASLTAFGNDHAWKALNKGQYAYITGKIAVFRDNLQIKSPELIPSTQVGRIIPVYRGKEKVVTPATVSKYVSVALREYMEEAVVKITSFVQASENTILQNIQSRFPALQNLLMAIHRPTDPENLESAIKDVRMINAFYAVKMSAKASKKLIDDQSSISFSDDVLIRQVNCLPFNLTQDQKRAVWGITKDLRSNVPMDRLVSGDVGCGKTLAYAIPAVCAYLSGKNAAIIMPNSLLAEQVADEIATTFPDSKVQMIVADQETFVLEKGVRPPIIVGTSAIIWWKKALKVDYEIDYLVVDEQQKIGADQKAVLISPHTNVLEATATAIPRTTAYVKYGDKKVSYIEQCPVDKKIDSFITGTEHRKEVYDDLVSVVSRGKQVAILYPLRKNDYKAYRLAYSSPEVGESLAAYLKKKRIKDQNSEEVFGHFIVRMKDKQISKLMEEFEQELSGENISLHEVLDPDADAMERRNVEEAAKKWEILFPGMVVVIHGGLSQEEKSNALRKAKSSECKVIVTTSVIEIGLTMPDLEALLVIEANRYGAGTLHQFRGRLARKGGYGKFFMAVNCPLAELDEKALNRLNLLIKFDKGSDIAHQDMLQRGFGDLNLGGQKQAGFVDSLFSGLKITPGDVSEFMKLDSKELPTPV